MLISSLNASKLLEMSRVRFQTCRKVGARPQLSVLAALPLSSPLPPPGPPAPPALPFLPRGSRGERGTFRRRWGWGSPREEDGGTRFPPAVPPGLTVRSASCFLCCEGREYFAREELNLPPTPERSRNLTPSPVRLRYLPGPVYF